MNAKDTTVFIEHVRAFAKGQRIPIRRLTLLVGENSSGKSSFLAVAASVFDRDGFPIHPNFNKPPFSLGTYETIATFKGGKYGRDESFSIGYSIGESGSRAYREATATYQRDRGIPGLVKYEGTCTRGKVSLRINNQTASGTIVLKHTDHSRERTIEFEVKAGSYPFVNQGLSLPTLLLMLGSSATKADKVDSDWIGALMDLGQHLQPPFANVIALAPIRTKPKRTYDELSEEYSPEGDHIPKLLARILSEEPSSQAAMGVRSALARFGEASGLFNSIDVKKLGRGQDDPFQVQVTLGGPKVNLVDVGYGVSQALPVIVQSVLRQDNSLLAIQQPEVHLHPRAQAALGTFFSELVSTGRNTIIIETHSDHLLDRVRQEVARGQYLKPEDVQILFFHKERHVTKAFPIAVDSHGNVQDAPECYREFFLEEELNLLQQGGT
jgi:hypothetical protein